MAISIVLADDHVVLRDGLRYLLDAEADFEVVGVAADGSEAVKKVIAHCPDVVLLDIAMPGMTGLEAAHRIQQVCPQSRVIMLSMHYSPEYIAGALQLGASGYLLKESASDEVLTAIRVVHSGERYLSREVAETVVDSYVNRHSEEPSLASLRLLTNREIDVLRLLVAGYTSAKAAEQLNLSPRTVDTYRSNIMRKLDIHHLPGLVKFAIKHGLTSIEDQ